jgi:hypothetical protein
VYLFLKLVLQNKQLPYFSSAFIRNMAHNEDHFPEAPYEDGGAVNFSIVYTILALVGITAIIVFG